MSERRAVSCRQVGMFGRLSSLLFAIGALALANSAAGAQAIVRPVIKTYRPVYMALPDFAADNSGDADAARAVVQAVVDDLELTKVFIFVDSEKVKNSAASVATPPSFSDWRALRVDELLVGSVTREPDGRLRVVFRLWDLFAETQLVGKQYVGRPDQMAEIGHMMSADIYDNVVRKWRR